MRAIVQHRYGGPERLVLAEWPMPAPARGEVLIRVRAAGVDAGTAHLMSGIPLLLRLGYGLRGPRVRTPGFAFAGTVAAVAGGVTAWRVGDEVVGSARGAFAEYLTAKAAGLVARPAAIDAVEAAGLPISGVTALQAVRREAGVIAGQRVLITGAGGGVGSFATQLSAAAGAEVTAVCGPAKLGLVRELGAAHAVDYTTTDITSRAGSPPFDAIIDIAGSRPLRAMRRILTSRGTLVVVGGEGGPLLDGLGRTLAASLHRSRGGQTLRSLVSTENPTDLATVVDLAVAGTIRTAVGSTYPLERASDALRALVDRRTLGKTILIVSEH